MKYTEGPFKTKEQVENRIRDLQFSDEGINYAFQPKKYRSLWMLEGIKVVFG